MLNAITSQLLPPVPADITLVTLVVKINGVPIPDTIPVSSVTVTYRCNRIPYALVTILDGDVPSQDFPSSNLDTFSPGQQIEISAGYSGANEQIFKGIIVRHSVKIMQDEASYIEIECKDQAVRLTAGRRNKYFFEKKDSEIIESILRDHQINPSVAATALRHKQMVQYYASDWDFLLTRAEANGMLALTDAGKVSVKKPDFAQDPKFTLNYGTSIYEFEAEMDARDQFPKAEATSWSPGDQRLIRISSGSFGGPEGGQGSALSSIAGSLGINLPGASPDTDFREVMGWRAYGLQHGGAFTNEECQAWADAQAIKSELAKKRGRVKFQGVADIRPGQCIQINGVGLRHSGKVFVTGVVHEIGEGVWFTHAQFGLPMRWTAQEFDDLNDTPAAALLPAVNGLQIGIVTELKGSPADPDFRIQVRLPLVETGGDGVWSRLAQQDAGANRGAVWRPEIGDEVIVGFINDDPRHAVVIGALHSAQNPAPIPAADENHEKGWITRSDMRLVFNDEKKSVAIQTPNGKQIRIDEDEDLIEISDRHQNRIVLDQNGIIIESGKDLTLKALQNMKIEAFKIQEEAQVSIEIQSQGQARIKATSDMEIGATFVRIN
ncbi:MAG: type VI secretion system tip protein VgrG [Saprospiraceae bacterium]